MPVYLKGGHDPRLKSEDVKNWEKRYFESYPMVTIMNADGHMIERLETADLDVEGILNALDRAEEAEKALKSLSRKRDRQGREAYAKLLIDRRAWPEALPVYERLVKSKRSPEAMETLALIHGKLGQQEREREILGTLILRYPSSKRRPAWRVRQATNVLEGLQPHHREGIETLYPEAIANLKELLEKVIDEKDKASEPFVRVELGVLSGNQFILRQGGSQQEPYDQLTRVMRDFPESGAAPLALFGLGELAATLGDYGRARQYMQRLLREHPEHDKAREAATWMKFLDRKLDK